LGVGIGVALDAKNNKNKSDKQGWFHSCLINFNQPSSILSSPS
jgi:hypothetical protein